MQFKAVIISQMEAKHQARRRRFFEILGILPMLKRDNGRINFPLDYRPPEFTVQQAQAWLNMYELIEKEDGRIINRDVSSRRLDDFGSAVDRGEWQDAGATTPYGVSYHGIPVNGQTRLTLQVLKGTTLYYPLCVLDVEPKNVDVIDSGGTTRSLEESLNCSEELALPRAITRPEAALFGYLPRSREDSRGYRTSGHQVKLSVTEGKMLLSKIKDGLVFLQSAFGSRQKDGVTIGPVKAAFLKAYYYYARTEENEELLTRCAKIICSCASECPEDTAAAVTGAYLFGNRKTTTRMEAHHRAEQAIRNFMSGKRVTRVGSLVTDELFDIREVLFPEPIPADPQVKSLAEPKVKRGTKPEAGSMGKSQAASA